VEIARLHDDHQQHTALIERLHLDVGQRDHRVEALTLTVAERTQEVHYLEQGVRDARAELEKVLASRSWQMTKPLRFLRRNTVPHLNKGLRKSISDVARWCWYNVPASVQSKQRFKNAVFSNLPSLLGGTAAFRNWANTRASHQRDELSRPSEDAAGRAARSEDYVPLLDAKRGLRSPAGMCAPGCEIGQADLLLPAAISFDPGERLLVGQGIHRVVQRASVTGAIHGPLPAARPR
jgi:hypothetical protein